MNAFVEIIPGAHADGATGCRSDYRIQSLLNRGFSQVPLPVAAHAEIDDPGTICCRPRNEINGFQQSHRIAQLSRSALIPRSVVYEHKVRFGCHSAWPVFSTAPCGDASDMRTMHGGGTPSGVRIRMIIAERSVRV